MDRKRYLELCQQNAAEQNSVNVIYQSGKYYPFALKIWFDENGKTMNTAVMECAVSKSILNARIEDLEEIKNDG